MIPLEWILATSTLVFAVGLYGVLVRRNAIIVLMSLELLLAAGILNFVSFSAYLDDPGGQVMALLAIALAAAEAAVGLAIFLALYRTHGTADLDKARFLRW